MYRPQWGLVVKHVTTIAHVSAMVAHNCEVHHLHLHVQVFYIRRTLFACLYVANYIYIIVKYIL